MPSLTSRACSPAPGCVRAERHLPAALLLCLFALAAPPPRPWPPEETPEVTVEDTPPRRGSPTKPACNGVVSRWAPGEAGTYQFPTKNRKRASVKAAGDVGAGLARAGHRKPRRTPTEAITGLTPGTEYAVCLRGRKRRGNGIAPSPAITFKTATPPRTAGEQRAPRTRSHRHHRDLKAP